jgi:DNA repair photolyase
MSVIYQPAGRAREYAEWACNLFRGCPHACAYCYVPDVLRRTGITRYEFHREAVPRNNILRQLELDAQKMSPRMVHLCFTCDPYPTVRSYPPPDQRTITRQAIHILKDAGHRVQILTKGGMDSISDLDLLDDGDEYATTLTFIDENDSRLWEPGAALPQDRLDALWTAQKHGIEPWASLEPVIYPEQSLDLLYAVIQLGVSKVKVGPLNYKNKLPKWLADTVPTDIDWSEFAATVQAACDRAGVECILKEDMKKLAGLG